MFIETPLPFIKTFIDDIDKAIGKYQSGDRLSIIQKSWLSFCIMAIFITNSVCWAKFRRASLGTYSLAALSWMFRNSRIPWEVLLQTSVRVVISKYGITGGVLLEDDTEKKRSKTTKRIFHVHKLKDKASGGYIMGQSIVLLFLVTPLISIPVGFSFYMSDPALRAWYKNEKKLKKKGIPKKERPAQPKRDFRYPTKQEIGLKLLKNFRESYPEIRIKLIVVDALYGTAEFMDIASKLFGGVQVLSQMRSNQKIRFRNKEKSVEKYFRSYPAIVEKIKIRGGEERVVLVNSARVYVCSHKTKRFIVALKYEGEEEYRYIVACDLSWRTLDIVQGYTLRWLVEVFFQDWKSYEGWGQLTKQLDEEGSSRSLILSLLLDHCLLFHPEQKARLENKLPAYTVGSLQEKTKVECVLEFIRGLISSDNIEEKLSLITEAIESVFQLSPSKKHMVNRELGRLEPTAGLKYRAQIASVQI